MEKHTKTAIGALALLTALSVFISVSDPGRELTVEELEAKAVAQQEREERSAERRREREAKRIAKQQERQEKEREKDLSRCNDSLYAYMNSQLFVERQLRSPSSAKFPRLSAQGVHVDNTDTCVHEIISYVEAQNAFGATVRTGYYAKVENVLGTNPVKSKLIELEFLN